MNAPQRPPPDALLERYLAGDLDAAMRASIDAALEASPEVRARLEALRADSAAYLVSHPPGPVAAKLPERRRWLAWFPVALAAAAAAVFVVVRPRADDEVTTKGAIALTVFRQSLDGGAAPLAPGSRVRAGDRLRFQVTAPDGHVVIVSRDGAGAVSVYFPQGGQTAATFDAQQPLLPVAIELDAVPGRERMWAVHGDRPFAVAPIVSQIEAGKAPAGPGLSVVELTWEKE